MLVFQYGSNCSTARLNSHDRLRGDAVAIGRADLDDYQLAFDVWSDGNNCAASDIVAAPGQTVQGVLFEIPDELMSRGTAPQGRRSFDGIEGRRYERVPITVRRPDGSRVQAVTYSARQDERKANIRTCSAYVSHIIIGLRQHGADPDYIETVIATACENNPAIAEEIRSL
jgi:cation transport regulator ChaC